jgi:hypothetical protein
MLILNYHSCFIFAQPNDKNVKTYKKDINEVNILDSNLITILDTIIQKHKKCNNYNNSYHWTISIKKIDNDTDRLIKSLYIRRLFYKELPIDGYGYFYHKGILFIIRGLHLPDVFRCKDKTETFNVYQAPPLMPFDPPRWLYLYIDNEFVSYERAPCGG